MNIMGTYSGVVHKLLLIHSPLGLRFRGCSQHHRPVLQAVAAGSSARLHVPDPRGRQVLNGYKRTSVGRKKGRHK